MVELATPYALVAAIVSGIVWAIRLEGRVNAQEQLFVEREKQAEAKSEADLEKHTDLKSRLVRIEDKIDALVYGIPPRKV